MANFIADLEDSDCEQDPPQVENGVAEDADDAEENKDENQQSDSNQAEKSHRLIEFRNSARYKKYHLTARRPRLVRRSARRRPPVNDVRAHLIAGAIMRCHNSDMQRQLLQHRRSENPDETCQDNSELLSQRQFRIIRDAHVLQIMAMLQQETRFNQLPPSIASQLVELDARINSRLQFYWVRQRVNTHLLQRFANAEGLTGRISPGFLFHRMLSQFYYLLRNYEPNIRRVPRIQYVPQIEIEHAETVVAPSPPPKSNTCDQKDLNKETEKKVVYMSHRLELPSNDFTVNESIQEGTSAISNNSETQSSCECTDQDIFQQLSTRTDLADSPLATDQPIVSTNSGAEHLSLVLNTDNDQEKEPMALVEPVGDVEVIVLGEQMKEEEQMLFAEPRNEEEILVLVEHRILEAQEAAKFEREEGLLSPTERAQAKKWFAYWC